jgi:hypothetical protein
MKRFVAVILAAAGVATTVGACDDGNDYLLPPTRASCSEATTCGSCTPLLGCGFCFTKNGGFCTDSPGDCPHASSAWTWDPSGCREHDRDDDGPDAHVLADAGIGDDAGDAGDARADAADAADAHD